MTRRVLLVSYFFPPLGGAGVQRTVKFARYLPEFGWEPLVVTGPGVTGDRWAPLDESLAEDTRGVEVIRTPGTLPVESGGGRLTNILRKAQGQSAFARWWPPAAVSAARSAPAADVVLVTMSPFETAKAAAMIARTRGVPWVADLRDPWALDEMFVYPTSLHRRWAEREMRRDLASASAIVMNTPEARARLLDRFPEFGDRPVVVISNGYDASDFTLPPPVRDDDCFWIVHTGYLHTESGIELRNRGRLRRMAGGAVAGLDMLTRSHVMLLDAVEDLGTRSDLARGLQLHLAGVTSDEDRRISSGMVRFHGYLPHSESIALIRKADLLFLPMHDLPTGKRATIIPGKTYEYLAAGRPILAAVPDGDARDLLAAAGNAYLVRPSDVRSMTRALVLAIEAKSGKVRMDPAPAEMLARYERRYLTGQVAALLDHVVSGESVDSD